MRQHAAQARTATGPGSTPRTATGPDAAGDGAAGDGAAGGGAAVAAPDPLLTTADCYARLGPVLRRYLRRWVPADDVEDVTQAAFLDLWRTRTRYDPARSLDAWALMIARRRAIDYLRSRPFPAAPLWAVADPPGPDGRDLAARHADAAELAGALSSLPHPQREAIVLAYYGDLSQREIAERLQVPISTIKARTARGLSRVRRQLGSGPA